MMMTTMTTTTKTTTGYDDDDDDGDDDMLDLRKHVLPSMGWLFANVQASQSRLVQKTFRLLDAVRYLPRKK